jgi:vancomycin resistance protein YoaR
VLGIGLPILVVMAFLGAWALDARAAAGGSLRNVEVAGRDVGGMDEDEVRDELAREAVAFAATKVTITAGATTITSTAADLGLGVDQDATVDAVLDEGRTGSALLRPFAWARSFVSPYEVAVRYAIRSDQLALVLSQEEGDEARQPVEPTIIASPETVRVQSGVAGKALDPDKVAERLLDAARGGEDPITVTVDPETRAPTVSDAEARAVAEEAEAFTAEPLVVTVAGKSVTFDVGELRSWIGSRVTGDGLELTFDEERIASSLRERVGSLGEAAPQSASFTVENGAVRLIPAVEGMTCCADDAAATIVAALRAGEPSVEVEPVTDEPELTTEEALALGIKEPVGTTTEWKGVQQVRSFTTYFDCCPPRTVNIKRIADLTRGALIMPGETFSLNGHVGQRTAEKGFVLAGAIANGEHVDEIGGGVSQFATTMFNAAFFAGLPFEAYQAHSEYFDRYPRGREATMGWENPDLAFTNDTPYGILIWTSHTDTSVTVTLYSTQHASGQQTGQTEERSGAACTRVTTTRTITYPDGRTATDTVGARYRDDGALTCDG